MSQESRVKSQEKKQNGQIVLILLLVMTVALAIGLSIVQGSLTDISTSTKVEQSSRAFSAAEAGIERALQGSNVVVREDFDNNASFDLVDSGLLPQPAYPPKALEYPPISKEEIVHVWLSNPNLTDANLVNPVDSADLVGKYYAQNQMDVYWGSADGFTSNPAAVELTVVYFDDASKTYKNKKYLLDPNEGRNNNFLKPSQSNGTFSCSDAGNELDTIFGTKRKFSCRATLTALPQTLVLLRARVLYSNASHPFAFAPHSVSSCSETAQMKNCSFPPQVSIIQSKGTSGDTQRTIQLFKVEKVVPFYFDYAIFAAGDINK